MVKLKLANGKYVNVDEEAAKEVEASEAASAKNLEETMNQLEEKNGEMAGIQAEVEELKGELSVYKEKLDELLATEAIEHAAAEMVEEQGEATEIMENAVICNEQGEEDEEKKKEFMNSARKLYGTKLHQHVLNSLGVKTDGMTPDALRGAFKAQHQIANAMKARKPSGEKKVAGTKLFNTAQPAGAVQTGQRTPRQRLGLPEK